MSLKISKKLTIVLGWFIWLNSWNMVHNISYPLDTKLVTVSKHNTVGATFITLHFTLDTKY